MQSRTQPNHPTPTKDPASRSHRRQAERLNPSCFACGSENPRGLHLKFAPPLPGRASLEWTPAENLESFRGIIHGGIVTTVLDEAMSHAVVASHWEALTAEVRVRFHQSVRAGEALHVSARVVERRKRKILTEATMKTAAGEERAHAWGTFLLLPGR